MFVLSWVPNTRTRACSQTAQNHVIIILVFTDVSEVTVALIERISQNRLKKVKVEIESA